MYDGFIKLAAGSPAVRVADCEHNASAIIRCCREAEEAGAHLLVLPELCVTAYTCGDLFFQRSLMQSAAQAVERVAAETAGLDLLIAVGVPFVWAGKRFNCAAVMQKGRILGIVPKSHLPNYGEFYERRHFSPASELGDSCTVDAFGQTDIPFGTKLLFCCKSLPEFVLALEICEDLWVPSPPSIEHAAAGATVIANLSASDEVIGKAAYRRELVAGQSARLVCGYAYAGAGMGESTTDMVFGAHNLIAENGALLAESKRFEYGIVQSEIDVQKLADERQRLQTFAGCLPEGYRQIVFSLPMRPTKLTRAIPVRPFIPANTEQCDQTCEEILRIQAHGLAKRLEHSRAQTAILGVSGGLDSTLALLVVVRAMALLNRSTSDVLSVTMPCFGTTSRTRSNAERLSRELGTTFRSIDISAAVRQHFVDIGHPEDQHDITFENSQARERTQVLMDLANRTNGLVVGTGDMSELALGWATYNGDQMSMYGVNSSVPKTLVRTLVAFEASQSEGERKHLLEDILATPVSPELLPPKDGEIAQITEDVVGPYDLHDFFLYYGIRWGFPPKKVFRLAQHAFDGQFEPAVILHWCQTFYRRFFSQQFKRSCMPDGPKIGSVTLSPRADWRMPADAVAALWLSELDALAGK